MVPAKNIHVVALFLVLVLVSPAYKAQYTGGNDDGYTSGSACAVSLNGAASALSINPISGPAYFCNNNMEEFRVTVATGSATSYSWILPSGASLYSGGGSYIKVLFGASGGNIQVTASNNCGESDVEIMALTNVACSMFSGGNDDGYSSDYECGTNLNGIISGSLSIGPITGPAAFCNNNIEEYSSSILTGAATSYSWLLPSGASVYSGGNNGYVKVLFGASGGNIQVTASNGCGESDTEILALTNVACSMFSGGNDDGYSSDYECGTSLNGITSGSLSIGPLTGPALFCNNNMEEYSSSVLTGVATSYTWLLPSGAAIYTGGSNAYAKVLFGTSGGNIQLTASNGCGESDTEVLAVTNVACSMFFGGSDDGYNSEYTCYTDLNGVLTGPLAISPISGATSVCNSSSAEYTFTVTAGTATSYDWYLSSGSSITAGGTSGFGRVQFGSTSGTMTVTASNGCGETDSELLAVTVNTCNMFNGQSNDGFAVQPSCAITLNGGDASTLASHLTYTVSCPGAGGTIISFSPEATFSFDYQETATSAFTYSGSYSGSTVQKTVTNGGTYDVEIKDATGCTDDIFNISTTPTPTTIPPANASGSCQSPGTNNWMYVTDASGNAIMAIDDNGTNLGIVSASVYVDGSVMTYAGVAYLQRHYKITTTNPPGGSGANIRLYLSATELSNLTTTAAGTATSMDDVASIASLGATKYDGPTEDGNYSPGDNTSLSFIAQSANGTQFGNNYIELNTPDFSEFWPHASSASSPLPIQLLYFAGINNGNYNLLEWATASEINNDFFTLERSVDGAVFEVAAIIDGAGNASTLNNYLFKDYTIFPGKMYYRLKQTDFNGQSSYSDIIAIFVNEDGLTEIKIYPNPLSQKEELMVFINEDHESVTIQLTDIPGKELIAKTFDLNKEPAILKIQVDDISPGLYILTVSSRHLKKSQKILIY